MSNCQQENWLTSNSNFNLKVPDITSISRANILVSTGRRKGGFLSSSETIWIIARHSGKINAVFLSREYQLRSNIVSFRFFFSGKTTDRTILWCTRVNRTKFTFWTFVSVEITLDFGCSHRSFVYDQQTLNGSSGNERVWGCTIGVKGGGSSHSYSRAELLFLAEKCIWGVGKCKVQQRRYLSRAKLDSASMTEIGIYIMDEHYSGETLLTGFTLISMLIRKMAAKKRYGE